MRPLVRSLRRALVALLAATCLAAGCGGSSSGAGDIAPDAGGDIGLPDGGDARADTTPADAKPLPDAADGADASPPPDTADHGDAADTARDARDATDTAADVDRPPACEAEIAPLLAEGTAWLEGAQPRMALPIFLEAEAACPESVDATFGAALAEMMDAVEIAMSLWTLIEQGTLASAFFDVILREESQDEWLAGRLHWAFASIAEKLRSSLGRLDTLVETDLAFHVARAPVYHATRPMLVYRGTFDRGDVHLMRLVAQNGIFLLDVLATQDFRTEWLTLITEIDERGFDGIATVFELLGRTLGGSPHFLTVHEEDGAAAYAEAGAMLAAMGDTWAAALDHLRSEEGDGAGEVSSLRDTAAGDMVVLAAGISVDADGGFTEGELRFVVPADFGAALDRLSGAVADPGTLVPWEEGPNWLLGAWLVVALKLDIVDLASLADLPIPLDNLDIRTTAGLLTTLTPFPFAFDFGTFFANDAVGLRRFLPRANATADGVLIEWECPDETAGDGLPDGTAGILCDAATTDEAHFVGTDLETVPDGVSSAFPYLGFDDPAMNGLLHVDLAAIGLAADPGYAAADATSLNAGLAAGFAPILNLLAN